MSDAALRWLAGREPAPSALAERLRAWAGAAPSDDVPTALGEASIAALRRALEMNGRAAALELLAADALITYACEAAAADEQTLTKVLDDFGPAAFAPLLDGDG